MNKRPESFVIIKVNIDDNGNLKVNNYQQIKGGNYQILGLLGMHIDIFDDIDCNVYLEEIPS